MNDQELLAVVATTDRYPLTRALPQGWTDDAPHDAQGRDTMSTIHQERPAKTEVTPPNPNRWRTAIAAIAVLVVAVAAMLIVNRDDSPDVADTPATTAPVVQSAATEAGRIAIAESIIDAVWSNDSQALIDIIGSDAASALIVGEQAKTHALHAELIDRQPCQATTASEVLCFTTQVDDFSRAFGYEPGEQRTGVIFSQDAVLLVTYDWSLPNFALGLWTTGWLDANHHEIMDEVCAGENSLGSGELRADDPEGCWAALVAVIPAFMASDSYEGPVNP